MKTSLNILPQWLAVIAAGWLASTGQDPASAGILTGEVETIPQGTDVNLTEIGTIDWVHWGLFTETSLNRKAGVVPRIGDFSPVYDEAGYAFVFQFADNFNTYSWSDGTPEAMVAETPTGVWAYGTPQIGSGFRFSIPADSQPRTLKVYVGAYAARGQFQAVLSDGSAPVYLDTSVFNMFNGPSRVYTLDFAADSPGQLLTVTYTLGMLRQPDGNVTLQAAALTVEDGNNPPIVTITNPAIDTNVAAGTDLTIEASANDVDGTVSSVEFFADAISLGLDDSGPPYSTIWSNAQPGRYLLTAVATDDMGASTVSPAVEVFVFENGGSLAGMTDFPSATVDLTQEGDADWVHWGYATNELVNRKAVVPPQIGTLTVLGTNTMELYDDNHTAFAWSDGAPVATAGGIDHGVFITGQAGGFEITAPADATPRQLRVYIGLYGATARMQAYLSDFSAMSYSDQSLSNVFGNSYAVYTFDYTAASPGQSLIMRYRSEQLFDQDFGNVTIQAATLRGGEVATNLPPIVTLTNPPDGGVFHAPAEIQLTAAAEDPDGTIARVEFYEGDNKLGESVAAPYELGWSNVAAGTYTLTARAEDDLGAVATSAPVQITIQAPPSPVVLLGPAWVGDMFVFSFLSQSNAVYSVRTTDVLPATNWMTTATLEGTGELLTVTNDVTGASQGFFQVITE